MSEIAIDNRVNKVALPKALNVTLWGVQALLALAFLGAASGKLMGKPEMVGLYEAIGVGQWFRYLTGILEASGAVMLVLPKTRIYGAGMLAMVMLGAIGTHLFVLSNAPTAPLVLLALIGFVIWGRRSEIPKLG